MKRLFLILSVMVSSITFSAPHAQDIGEEEVFCWRRGRHVVHAR